MEGRLRLHRWCQWISAYYPSGVYDGEESKLPDFSTSVPKFLLSQFVKPSLSRNKLPVILGEEWHTADAMIRTHALLCAEGFEKQVLLLWNANNTMSFDRVDWNRLVQVAALTTVSRYMKHLMWRHGVNPLVIPNGIPSRLLRAVPPARRKKLRQVLDSDGETVILFKAGRFDPAKRWIMAIEAASLIKASGHPVACVLSGGIEPHGTEVLARARHLGLTISEIFGSPNSPSDLFRLIGASRRADIYNLHCFLNGENLRLLYSTADAVLANSGHEPFGLVGLEAMAAGGVVFAGSTGEDYAVSGLNAVVLDTDRPEEIALEVSRLVREPERAAGLRRAARRQAADYTWEKAIDVLLEKIHFVAQARELAPSKKPPAQIQQVKDVVIYLVVHQPRRLRIPAQPIPRDASPAELEELLFDERLNEKYFRKVAAHSYDPAVDLLSQLLDRGLKLAIGFSLSFVEQAEKWGPDLLDRFRKLVARKEVELVAVEPRHSFISLVDILRFSDEMQKSVDRLSDVFAVRPVSTDTTELMMSDTIYHALERVGFKAGFLDGRPWVMEWRRPTHVYHHGSGSMKLLARHHQLSDDVGYRFSNRQWQGWPLMADEYALWLSSCPGNVVVLGWDFETFGEHQPKESGIFEFLQALPNEIKKCGLSFTTPTEAIQRYGKGSFDLPLSAFPSTWAGSGGLEFFLGNDAQRAVFELMIEAYQKASLTQDNSLIDIALWLMQSDNLHLIQWHGRAGPEAEVSAYFTPLEWWDLTPDRIVWEMQQVYQNFIAWMDGSVP
jgi:alpha-amylase